LVEQAEKGARHVFKCRVETSLFQLQAAARLPGGGISELGVNSALALIEGAAPKDEIEGALAVQMACTHIAAMALLARLQDGYQTERRTSLFATAASRLLRVMSAGERSMNDI
jgi:hypothetical protein